MLSPLQNEERPTVLEFLYRALRSARGIAIRHDGEFEPIRQKLYAARRDSCDHDLDALGFTRDPTDPQQIFVVKK